MFDDFNGLKVTEIRIKLADDPAHDCLRAFVSVALNNAIVINHITVIETSQGRIIASFPAKKKRDGSHRDVTHPIDHAARRWLETIILRQYARECQYKAAWDAAINSDPVRLQAAG